MDSKRLKIIVYAVLIVFGIVVLFATIRMFEKDGEGSNYHREPYKPNDVVVDNFTYSILKLRANNQNMVYSPLSIKYAMFMLRDGAAGKTYDEINNIIGNLSLTKYENIDKVLSLANSVFIKDSYKKFVLDSYVDNLKNNYDAEVIYDEFKNADNVNKWIANKTFDIIKKMLSDEMVSDANLEMMLINALAIDMNWDQQFEPEHTSRGIFTKVDGEEMATAMMHQSIIQDWFKYYKDDNYTALSMPLQNYNGTQLEFIAVLPENVSLKDFIVANDFDSNFSNIINSLHGLNGKKLVVSIPRFEYNYGISIVDDMKHIGINDAFDEVNANFSKMSSSELYVSDILHKADIKFSEKGIKAAAATVIFMSDKAEIAEPMEIVELVFNKPFVYIIRDASTQEVWFTGTVYEPVKWDDVKDDYQYR